jgi:AcrR family transcriptional regulator
MPKIITEYREEARRRIIETGLAVLCEKGYAKTTMEEIARRLDVTKPALYRYFKNKDELIIESAKERHSGFIRDDGTQNEPDCPFFPWIELFDRLMVPDPKIHAAYFEIIALTSRNDDLRGFSGRQMFDWIDQISLRIHDWQERGWINSDADPVELSVTLIALFTGIRMQIVLGVGLPMLRRTWIADLHRLFAPGGVISLSSCHECVWWKDCRKGPAREDSSSSPNLPIPDMV